MALSPREIVARYKQAHEEMRKTVETFIDQTLTERYNPTQPVTIARMSITSKTGCRQTVLDDVLERYRYVGWNVTVQADRDGTFYQFEHKQ
jgi:hypothetical protein